MVVLGTRSGRRRIRLAAVGAVAALLAGCSTSVTGSPTASLTVPSATGGAESSSASSAASPVSSSSAPSSTGGSGTAAPEPSSGSASSGPADTGDYPTTPAQLPATTTGTSADLLEARRIGAFIPVPTFVISSYTEVASISTYPLKSADALSTLFTDPVPAVARRAGMITGFSVSRHDKQNDGVVLAAFEFPSAQAAATAMPAMAAGDVDKSADKPSPKIPGVAGAVGRYYVSDGKHTMSYFVAQGAMVIYVWAESPAEATTLTVMGRMFTALTTSFKAFTPTPPQQITGLPVDQDGLLAHTLPEKSGNHTVYAGLYTPNAVIHYFSEPAEFRADVTAAHVDLVTVGAGQLYRAGDGDAAAKLRDTMYAQSLAENKDEQPYTLPGSYPQTKCWQKALSSEYDCIGVHGRDVYDLPGTSEADIAQAVAAQEAILTGF